MIHLIAGSANRYHYLLIEEVVLSILQTPIKYNRLLRIMAYQSLLTVLQGKHKLSVAELKKVERVQKTSVSESVPQLLVKLG